MRENLFCDKVFSANARATSESVFALAEWLTIEQLLKTIEKQ